MTHGELETLKIQAPHFFRCPNCGIDIEPEAIAETLTAEDFQPSDYYALSFFCPGYTFDEGVCGGETEETGAYWQMG